MPRDGIGEMRVKDAGDAVSRPARCCHQPGPTAPRRDRCQGGAEDAGHVVGDRRTGVAHVRGEQLRQERTYGAERDTIKVEPR